MRLFIAFDVGSEAKKELQKTQEKLSLEGLKLVKDFHLTLKFLGDVRDENLDSIKEKLQKIKFESFEASLGSMGAFPSENHIKVIWVGAEPEEKIREVQQMVEDSLKEFFPRDNRFHPHITLARVKQVKDRQKLKELIAGIEVNKISFPVLSIKLVKSTLKPEGPAYEVIREVKAADQH